MVMARIGDFFAGVGRGYGYGQNWGFFFMTVRTGVGRGRGGEDSDFSKRTKPYLFMYGQQFFSDQAHIS
jgi:hypothetical protein